MNQTHQGMKAHKWLSQLSSAEPLQSMNAQELEEVAGEAVITHGESGGVSISISGGSFAGNFFHAESNKVPSRHSTRIRHAILGNAQSDGRARLEPRKRKFDHQTMPHLVWK